MTQMMQYHTLDCYSRAGADDNQSRHWRMTDSPSPISCVGRIEDHHNEPLSEAFTMENM
jgi:hypothetical protein